MSDSTDNRRKLLIVVLCAAACLLPVAVWWSLSSEYLGAAPRRGYDLSRANYQQALVAPQGPLIEVTIPKLVIGKEQSEILPLPLPEKLPVSGRLKMVCAIEVPKTVRAALLSVYFLAPVKTPKGEVVNSFAGCNKPWSRADGATIGIEVDIPSQKGRYTVEIHLNPTESDPNQRILASGVVDVE